MGLECFVVVLRTKGDQEVVVAIREEKRQPNIKRGFEMRRTKKKKKKR